MLAASTSAAAHAESPGLPEVTVASPRDTPSETTDSYTSANLQRAATGLSLSPRETPQPVSVLTRQQLDDQRVRTLDDLAWAAPGLTRSREQLYARGFAISNVLQDGLSTTFDKTLDLTQSLVMYDRVEILQGASGLMQGTGNPSATLNLVRKRPTAKPTVNLATSAGSWGYRSAMLDAGGPLGGNGSLRGRLVADARNEHSFQSVVARRSHTIYGILEADLGTHTMLSVGASHQKNNHRDSLAGIPTDPGGADLHLPRSTYMGNDWNHSTQYTRTFFSQLEHQLPNGWQLKLDAQRSQSGLGLLTTYLTGGPPTDLHQGLGQYHYRTSQTAYAASLSGPLDWGGRQHQLALGASRRSQSLHGQGLTVLDFFSGIQATGWNPYSVPRPDLNALAPYAYHLRQSNQPTQTGTWLSGRFSLSGRLSLILGGRMDWYHQESLVQDSFAEQRTDVRSTRHLSHYGGLVYDVDAQHSLYASFTDIFQPRTERDVAGRLLPATQGHTWAAGIKGAYADNRLHAGIHLFQTTQQHQPEPVYSQALCPSYPTVSCYQSSDEVRSQGMELELRGAITPAWQIAASYSSIHSRYTRDATRQGQRFEPQLPGRQFKLATAWRLPGGHWRIGANIYRQSAITSQGVDMLTNIPYRMRQPAFTVLGLMAEYRFSPQLQLQLQISNLLDQRYYQSIEAPTFSRYGAARSAMLTLEYRH